MRWEDERYVRLYTRDTVDWLALSWDAQALLMQLLRKVDRAGILPLGKRGRAAVPFVFGRPDMAERIAAALGELEADGCVIVDAERLVFRNFIEAQEAQHTDKARKRAQRERDRDKLVAGGFKGSDAGADIVASLERAQGTANGHAVTDSVTPAVTAGHTETGSVTARDQNRDSGHAASREVTAGHAVTKNVTPSRAVPCPAVPSESTDKKNALAVQARDTPATQVPAPSTQRATERASAVQPPTPAVPVGALEDGVRAVWRKRRGGDYPFQGRDLKASRELLGLSGGDIPEILARWDRALQVPEGQYPYCSELEHLVRHWTRFAGPAKGAAPAGANVLKVTRPAPAGGVS